jgi:hypothetical protein
MRNVAFNTMMGLALAVAVPVGMIGCDTTEETKSVDVKDDGTVVKEKTKTTEGADGTVTKTEEKKVDKP